MLLIRRNRIFRRFVVRDDILWNCKNGTERSPRNYQHNLLGLFLGLLHLIWEVFSIFNNSYVIGSIHVELLVSC